MLENKINVHKFSLLFALICGLNLILNSTKIKAKPKLETRSVIFFDYGGLMKNIEHDYYEIKSGTQSLLRSKLF